MSCGVQSLCRETTAEKDALKITVLDAWDRPGYF